MSFSNDYEKGLSQRQWDRHTMSDEEFLEKYPPQIKQPTTKLVDRLFEHFVVWVIEHEDTYSARITFNPKIGKYFVNEMIINSFEV